MPIKINNHNKNGGITKTQKMMKYDIETESPFFINYDMILIQAKRRKKCEN